MSLQPVLCDSSRRQYRESIEQNNHLMVHAKTLIKLLYKIKLKIGRHWKVNKNEQGEWFLAFVYVRFLKKMLRFSKWSFIVILPFFLLVIMAVLNIKQTIMKDYNIQSCQWMACDRFRQPFLLCTTFRSFLCTIHYFLCPSSAKMDLY